MYLKNGKHLELCYGIHTGPVISAVLGELKPQFSLNGNTVYYTNLVCQGAEPQRVIVSKDTHRYLELYTNNYMFNKAFVTIKGKVEGVFCVSTMKGRFRTIQDKNSHAIKNFDGQLNAEKTAGQTNKGQAADKNEGLDDNGDKQHASNGKGNSGGQVLNESESVNSEDHQGESANTGFDKDWNNVNAENDNQ